MRDLTLEIESVEALWSIKGELAKLTSLKKLKLKLNPPTSGYVHREDGNHAAILIQDLLVQNRILILELTSFKELDCVTPLLKSVS